MVFGEVVEGLGLVSRMEQQGSSGGATRQRVAILDCGEVRHRVVFVMPIGTDLVVSFTTTKREGRPIIEGRVGLSFRLFLAVSASRLHERWAILE